MIDALPVRGFLMHMLDLLAEWQMRQSLRTICRSHKS